jgi:hypothetical protein
MTRMRMTLLSLAVLMLCLMAPLVLAQVPIPPAGSGTVIAVDAQGMATVKVGEQQQTVPLPQAKVGDKVDCKVAAGPWQCKVQEK